MYLVWIALATRVLAIFVVAYLSWFIGKEFAGTPQRGKIPSYTEDSCPMARIFFGWF